MWNDKEKLFASAVWAQDMIVGAVLDELEALDIEKDTVVFFSGDNGPDIPGEKTQPSHRSIYQGIILDHIGMIIWVG